MRITNLFCGLAVLVLAQITPADSIAQQVDIDFESAMIGDSLGTLGFTGAYATETITAVGVSGSKGVEIATHDTWFPVALLRDQDFGGEITSAEFSIDAQVQHTGPVGDRSPLFYLTLGSENSRELLTVNFVRYPEKYAHFLFNGVPNSDPFEESSQNSDSELGFSASGLSDYFRLKMEVRKTGDNSYDLTGSVRDIDGTVLQSVDILGSDFSNLFDDEPIYYGFGLNSNSLTAANNVRFDNFSFSVTTLPKPIVGLVGSDGCMVTGLPGQCLVTSNINRICVQEMMANDCERLRCSSRVRPRRCRLFGRIKNCGRSRR